MKISIFGTGYVGLVSGSCFAEMGHDVTCVDIDAQKINALNQAECPIYEPQLNDLIRKNIVSCRLQFTTDTQSAIASAEVIFIAVNTPNGPDGKVDLSHIINVIESIDGYDTRVQKILVVKSTVPIGTHALLKNRIKNQKRLKLCSNPEFLREGNAVYDFFNPSRIILGVEGSDEKNILTEIYSPLVKNIDQIIIMDPASSEATKYAANAMLATRISLMNEFSRLCEKTNADIKLVEKGIGTDPRIGHHFLKAGIGYGGSCLPKDIHALINLGHAYDEDLKIISAVEKTNELQKIKFLDKIKNHFSSLSKLRLTVWGTSFKPGTDDTREAPAIFLIAELLKLGAHITLCDPQSAHKVQKYFYSENVNVVADIYESISESSAIILTTEWDLFLNPDFSTIKNKMKTPVIFDGRNAYSSRALKNLGFSYYGVGTL